MDFEKYDFATDAPGYRPIKVGGIWGGDGKSGWFRLRFIIPESFAGKPAAMLIGIGTAGAATALNCEAVIYRDGIPLQGIDINHQELLLSESAEPGKSYELDAADMRSHTCL